MYLTVAEVAQRLKIGVSTVYVLINSGQLLHHRIGARRGAIRISEDDLAAYLANCHAATRDASSPVSPTPMRKLKHLKL